MQAEARRCFAPQVPGIPSAEVVVARVFAQDPVPWLRLHDYQARRMRPPPLRHAAGRETAASP